VSNVTDAPLGKPQERRGFFGLGKGLMQPINPAAVLSKSDTSKASHAWLVARERLKKKNEVDISVIPEEEQIKIVEGVMKRRWWWPLYAPFHRFKGSTLHSVRSLGSIVLCVIIAIEFIVAYNFVVAERIMVEELSPEDRELYVTMLLSGLRYSELFCIGLELLQREDPHEALPAEARVHIVLEEARRRGWDKLNWDEEEHRRYKTSPLFDMDVYHLGYWGCMYVGYLLSGTFFGKAAGKIEHEVFQLRKKKRKTLISGATGPPPSS
jgi:hypothetical protein